MGELRAVVVGTGMMGPGIAASLATAGIDTTLVSRSSQSASNGLAQSKGQLQILRDCGLISPEKFERGNSCLGSSVMLDQLLPTADLVIESIPEDLRLKQQFFRHADALAPERAILGSNTSGISISEIAEGTKNPERIMTAHFWNPPHLMPLVEIVMGKRTDEAQALRLMSILRNCGKTPVLVRKDTPGQLGNRLQQALVREALHIVNEGIASVEDVDLAVKKGFGLRMPAWGVLEHIDAVGLDLVKSVQDYVLPHLNHDTKASPLLAEKLAKGEAGAKLGKGFYDWNVRDIQAAKARRDQFLILYMTEQKDNL
jgi:3-hydroxybutyryl-CoA dehydrogenase